MWDPVSIEAHGGDLHRVEIVASLEGLGLDGQPDVPDDWRECYSTETLEVLEEAFAAFDLGHFGQAIAAANAELARDFH